MGENSDNDWLIFDDGDDLHPAAMTVGGIGVLRVANVRFCERAALRDRPVLADCGHPGHYFPKQIHTSMSSMLALRIPIRRVVPVGYFPTKA